jgi:hypothetical protein
MNEIVTLRVRFSAEDIDNFLSHELKADETLQDVLLQPFYSLYDAFHFYREVLSGYDLKTINVSFPRSCRRPSRSSVRATTRPLQRWMRSAVTFSGLLRLASSSKPSRQLLQNNG